MEESFHGKLAELRSVCFRDIQIQQQRMEDSYSSFRRSLQSINSKSQQAAENQVKLVKLKTQLRESEDELVKALAVKTRKEAKRMEMMDSISVAKANVEELSRSFHELKDRKDEYERIISQQLKALGASEEKINQGKVNRDEIEEACAWYNNVLGLRIEGGYGVKFTFTNINRNCPSEEYSFTVRHANNVYDLLDCNPQLNDMEELVDELNKTNGLFKFVRVMRARFQQASGSAPPRQDADVLSIAAPSSLLSTETKFESPEPLRESNRTVDKSDLNRRRSPRFASRDKR